MTHCIQFVNLTDAEAARFIRWCSKVCFHKYDVDYVNGEYHFRFYDRMDADRFVLCHRDFLEAL